MHYGVRGASLPDGHLFLILVQCLKPHTGSLLKELDNRVQYIGYLESARCHARCYPGACTSEPQNHLWRQIVFSPLFLGGNQSSEKLGNLPGWLCWNLNPPLSDPRSVCPTVRPRDLRRLPSTCPGRRKITAAVVPQRFQWMCPMLNSPQRASQLPSGNSQCEKQPWRHFRETVFMGFTPLGEVGPLNTQHQGQPHSC